MPHSSGKNSLVGNIHRRKVQGKSRSKKNSTISKKAYAEMKRGWKKKQLVLGYWGIPCPACDKILSTTYSEDLQKVSLVCKNKKCKNYGK